tara:strand:+ start:796 stop:1686 length:891 start_codon:yes stop_codon:yes gene_type:complete
MINDPRLKKHSFGFYEVVDKPTQEELNAYYAEKYYQEAKGSYEQTYDQDELEYIWLKIKQRAYLVKQLTGRTEGSLLDLGCGEGFTLKHYADLGWQVQGIDFSKAGVKKQNPEMRDYVYVGDIYETINRYQNENRSYDVVYLTNVLEHVLDPIELLKNLKSIVTRGGILVVTVPNDGSDLQEYCFASSKISERFWIVLPDHISYFTYESLQSITENTGWNSADIIADFPVDLFLLHHGSNYIQDKKNGKPAHRARIASEIMLSKRNIQDVIQYYRSMAKVGMGRDLTGFFINNNQL